MSEPISHSVIFEHAPVLNIYIGGAEEDREIIDFSKYNPVTNKGYILFYFEDVRAGSISIEKLDDCRITEIIYEDRIDYTFLDNSICEEFIVFGDEDLDEYEDENFDFC